MAKKVRCINRGSISMQNKLRNDQIRFKDAVARLGLCVSTMHGVFSMWQRTFDKWDVFVHIKRTGTDRWFASVVICIPGHKTPIDMSHLTQPLKRWSNSCSTCLEQLATFLESSRENAQGKIRKCANPFGYMEDVRYIDGKFHQPFIHLHDIPPFILGKLRRNWHHRKDYVMSFLTRFAVEERPYPFHVFQQIALFL